MSKILLIDNICNISNPCFDLLSILHHRQTDTLYNNFFEIKQCGDTECLQQLYQSDKAPSTMKLIKVCEYSLKVLGENVFITNCMNNLHIKYKQVCKTQHLQMYAKMYIQFVIKNILINQLNPLYTYSHFNIEIAFFSNYYKVLFKSLRRLIYKINSRKSIINFIQKYQKL
ncbi:unnamed protein product [Paramecium primaurelia]|uniref:Uncharacterized protein n=1 Tax=Paramecium primaurelia TaxID=5886 RepID=A0A8S1KT40_PARPR|nr:unnamed protein product [Paramecium primaurelia]